MKPFKNADQAAKYIEQFDGMASQLKLAIDVTLLDPIGINMAIITDKILDRGWEPDGFEEKEGYKIFRYKESE